MLDNLTTKYYSTSKIKSSFNPTGKWISMPIICEVNDTVALILLSTDGKYKNAYGFPTLAKAKASTENKNGKGNVAFYKLHTNKDNCSKSLKGDLISINQNF
jgi:hypothetical protein